MPLSLFAKDTKTTIHRGAIYKYRPIFWVSPPLWVLREVEWSPPRHAAVHRWEELRDAFRLSSQENQEQIVASAKVRYIVVLSNEFEANEKKFKDVVVAPTYSIHPEKHRQQFLKGLREGRYPDLFYLPADPDYPELGECYIDFRNVQLLNKSFMKDGKLDVAFTSTAIKAILHRYKQYWSWDIG
jgi:hypothetical protein